MLQSPTFATWGTGAWESPPFGCKDPIGKGTSLAAILLMAVTCLLGLRQCLPRPFSGELLAELRLCVDSWTSGGRARVGAGEKASLGCRMDPDSHSNGRETKLREY